MRFPTIWLPTGEEGDELLERASELILAADDRGVIVRSTCEAAERVAVEIGEDFGMQGHQNHRTSPSRG